VPPCPGSRMYPRLASNWTASCIGLLSDRITGVHTIPSLPCFFLGYTRSGSHLWPLPVTSDVFFLTSGPDTCYLLYPALRSHGTT
jgi:hypothetical protein